MNIFLTCLAIFQILSLGLSDILRLWILEHGIASAHTHPGNTAHSQLSPLLSANIEGNFDDTPEMFVEYPTYKYLTPLTH